VTNKLALIEQLREFPTALVADALRLLGCQEAEHNYLGHDVARMTRSSEPTVGVAVTWQVDSSSPDNASDVDLMWRSFEEIDQSPLPVVAVAKSVGARKQHSCVLGDGVAKMLQAVGSVGFVTDGGIRDIEGLERLGYAVYAAGRAANHTNLRISGLNDPVNIGGVKINPGDLIHADRDGVMLVPEGFHFGLIEACLLWRDYETRAHTFRRRSDKSVQEKREIPAQIQARVKQRIAEILHGGGDPWYM
jgi:4-hydroxy-4-methyl-2-oxoglutarate aldolase